MELETYYIVNIFTTSIEYLECNQTNATGSDVKVSILCVNETIIWLKTEINISSSRCFLKHIYIPKRKQFI